jgi:hypothetical protein
LTVYAYIFERKCASWDEGKPVKFVDKMTSDQMTMHWEMFTYAIFKGGLIKHSSHSDNHQSQAVTMLICEVMTLIVSVSLVNNSLIFPHFETCADHMIIIFKAIVWKEQ